MPITLDGTTGIILSGAAGLSQTGDGELTLGNTLDVASGGTGANNLNGIVKGDGTNALTAGKVSLSTEISGTLNVASGGTGGLLPVANGGTGLTDVGTTGNVLTSNGTSWISQAPTATINLRSQVTNTLQVANGGTGVTTSTGTGNVVLSDSATVSNTTIIAFKENRVTMSANDINLILGNYFTKTISTTTTLTVSNVAATGIVNSFVLDLTNGGSSTVNWWTGVKWASGTAPTLTTSGRDSLGFFTYDAGTTWTGLVLGKDLK